MRPPLKDDAYFIDGVEYRVVRQIGETDVQLENCKTGEIQQQSFSALEEAYMQGRLRTGAVAQRSVITGQRRRTPARMDYMSQAARAETRRRIDYLVNLERFGAFELPRAGLRRSLAQIAQQRGEARPPHETTVYRWRAMYLAAQDDVRALFSAIDQRGGRGGCRLDPAVEAMIDEAIDAKYLSNRRASAQDVHDAVAKAVQVANANKPLEQRLLTPAIRTINRRIAKLCSFDVAEAQYGLREAKRRHAPFGRARMVDRILEIVEIDHTPVDILVTEKDRVVVGRPTLTAVIDRASRCVLGYHLSLAGHGTYAVLSALRHAMLPKTYLNKVYPDLGLDWPCYGWPERILVDNGREFHSEAVRDAMANLSVLVEFAGSRDPNDKPFVERFLRTFNYSFIHKLPGTTLAKVHQRVGFKAEEEACLTLEELDRMIHVWICNVYHRKPHRGLDERAPIDVWSAGAKAFPPQLKMSRDDVDIEFSEPVKNRHLHHYGIEINTFEYASPRLTTLRAMLPPGSKVDIKWPHDNAGHIWVWDPSATEYFAVANKDPQYSGLTVEQAKAAKRYKAQDPEYQRVNADAKDIIAEVTAAALKDKKLKERRRGARQAHKTSNALREPKAPPAAATQPAPTSRPKAGLRVRIELPEPKQEV